MTGIEKTAPFRLPIIPILPDVKTEKRFSFMNIMMKFTTGLTNVTKKIKTSEQTEIQKGNMEASEKNETALRRTKRSVSYTINPSSAKLHDWTDKPIKSVKPKTGISQNLSHDDMLLVDKDGKSFDFTNYNNKLAGKNDEYLLSIHCTKMRSRSRRHLRGSNDIIVLNKGAIEKSKTDSSSTVSKVLAQIDSKYNHAIESLSFSGGGYNCMYHMGVVRYIFENPELFKGTKYLGASGGAGIMAIVLCFESDPDRFKIIDKLINEVVLMNGKGLKLYQQVDEYINILCSFITLEKFDKYIKNSDRCHISVTDVTRIIPYNDVKTKFCSYSQFLGMLKATACIPFILDDTIREVDSRRYLDGGLSNNLPVLNDKTIKVSCLNYPLLKADIYPKDICELKYAFTPPPKSYIMNMHDLGYNNIKERLKDTKKTVDQNTRERELDACIIEMVGDPNFVKDE
jgi:hypothetical protein